MTDRLYYGDAKLKRFTAKIISKRKGEKGLELKLDRSAFYPTSGGQPHDLGWLNGEAIIDVWADEGGDVWHLLEGSLDVTEVHGEIDWERRFDHMQQHTGQHMLSAAFLDLYAAGTLSFHLGSEISTIDLDISSLDWQEAFDVEAVVNQVVWENRKVIIKNVEPNDIDKVPLRKPPVVEGNIRVIWIEGYDASACGGTHVDTTGEIGLIKIVSLERYKGGIRVGFLCGKRALNDYRVTLRILQETSASLSVHRDDLQEAVRKLDVDARDSKRSWKDAQGKLIDLEAQKLWENTPERDGIRRFVGCYDDRSFEEVRLLAMGLREMPNVVVLFAVEDEKGLRLVCVRSDDLQAISADELLTYAAEAIGGRAGGSPTIAQGGAPLRSCSEVTDIFKQIIDTI